MAETLTEYLQENQPAPFRAVPRYFPGGDFLTYYLSPDRCRAVRLDDIVTVYLADESERLVGCKIKGVRHILQTAGDFGVRVDGGDGIRLGFFFFAGAAPDRAGREPVMERYKLLREIANVTIGKEELAAAHA